MDTTSLIQLRFAETPDPSLAVIAHASLTKETYERRLTYLGDEPWMPVIRVRHEDLKELYLSLAYDNPRPHAGYEDYWRKASMDLALSRELFARHLLVAAGFKDDRELGSIHRIEFERDGYFAWGKDPAKAVHVHSAALTGHELMEKAVSFLERRGLAPIQEDDDD